MQLLRRISFKSLLLNKIEMIMAHSKIIVLSIIFGIVFALALSDSIPRHSAYGSKRLDRSKRYALMGHGHENKAISYKITEYSKNITNKEVDDVLRRAFNIWTEHTDLTFTQKEPNEEADITVRFAVREHKCVSPFDGRGGVLAHASKSFVHFDDEEIWKATNIEEGTSLYKVAVHEIGHSLGLAHSQEQGAIMFWAHTDDEEDQWKLDEDDILGVQVIYGEKKIKPVFDLNLCKDPTFDTIFDTPDEKTYILKKDKYYQIEGTVIVDGPKPIAEKWIGLPESIDGAFSQNGKTFFFKGGNYWRYTGYEMDEEYPQRLGRWYSEIPDNFNDVTVWEDGKVYFFRGTEVYKIDEFNEKYTTVEKKYIVEEWKGIPNHTDAIHYSERFGATFFFKVDNFYVFESSPSAPEPYIIPTISYFFGCKSLN